MFRVDNRIINEAPLNILKKLHDSLEERGINLIRDIKISGINIQCTCPFHNGGQEKRASAGILMVDRGNQPAGTFHCFTCGVTMNLEEMISGCFGYNDLGSYGRKWLIKNFITFEDDNKREIKFNFERKKDINSIITNKEDLSLFRYTHQYMYDRKLTDDIIDKFDIGYDRERDSITFPVYDLDGNLCFVGRRSIKGKIYNYPKNVEKPVYGLNMIKGKEVIICESVFNALTCWVYGKEAVALLGTGSKYQYKILKMFPARKYILAFDGDEAGDRGRNKFIRNVKNKIITYYNLPRGKDINDLTLEEFNKLEEQDGYKRVY